ncbi:MAG: hypothetical protein DKT66_28265 [Candidatus Melainabacteria bacterium]|jgi:tetratricopeptide (TPR) repeat protein|nr:MAG: hypothetical protein DKT66_28265 [Candidatus Melainabacteria bacterium]
MDKKKDPEKISQKALGLATSALTARVTGNLSIADELAVQALNLVDLADGKDFVEALESRVFNSSDCMSELQKLLDIQARSLGPDHPQVLETLNRLLLRWSSWLSDYNVLLAPVYERLVALRLQQLGPNHPEIADLLMNFSEYLASRGANVDAQNCLTRAVTIRKANFEKTPSSTLSYAQAVTRLGCLLVTMGSYDLAEGYLKSACDLLDATRSRLKLHAFEDLAVAYTEMGKYGEAEAVLKKALLTKDTDSLTTIANCAVQLGSIFLYWGWLDDAVSLFDFSINFDRDSTWTLPGITEKQVVSDDLQNGCNPLEEIFDSLQERYSASDMRRFCRNLMVRKYSWAIPSKNVLKAIAEVGPLVEIGAGTGYWAALLRNRGADIIAYDFAPSATGRNGYTLKTNSWTEVLPATETTVAYHPDRTLFLCWPPLNDEMAYRALRAYTGDSLIYIGEPFPGCTADENFHDRLEKNWVLVKKIDLKRWHLIKDSAFFYTRK